MLVTWGKSVIILNETHKKLTVCLKMFVIICRGKNMDTGISSRVLNEIKDMAKKNQLDLQWMLMKRHIHF